MIDLSAFKASLHGKPLAIFGLGKTGLSSARTLRSSGIDLILGDDSPEKRKEAENEGFKTADLTSDAALKNCVGLLLSPGVPLHFPAPHPIVVAARTAGIEIFCDIEILHRAGHRHPTIGITGTNGKSTTTALIAHILQAGGQPAVAAGNIGIPVLSIDLPPQKAPLVLELSSYQLDLCPTFRPDIAIHLNLTPDHLDRHGTLENYAAAKERIFEGPGTAICGIDDPLSREMYQKTLEKNERAAVIPISCLRPLERGIFLEGTTLVDAWFEGKTRIDLSPLPTLRGRHNHQNALAAYAAARAQGYPPREIAAALTTYPGLPHRQFLIRAIQGVSYINDSKATNADATEKALAAFDHIYWIAGGLPKTGGLTGLEGFAPKIRHAFLIGQAAPDFAAWMIQQKIPFTLCETLERAGQAAHDLAQSDVQQGKPPGTVLLSPACASWDQFKSYEHRGDEFARLVLALPLKSAA